jgi:acetaldehyde dehydrogenase/alcohol dehydrogenase
MADYLEIEGNTPEEKVEGLITAIDKLKASVGIPSSISEAGVPEKDFYARLDQLSELAFDDQCTGANPRYPSINEIKELYIQTFHGSGNKLN